MNILLLIVTLFCQAVVAFFSFRSIYLKNKSVSLLEYIKSHQFLIIGMVLIDAFLLFVLFTVLTRTDALLEKSVLFLVLNIVNALFSFISLYDVRNLEIHNKSAIRLLLIVSLFHIFLGIGNYWAYRISGHSFYQIIPFGDISLLLGGLVTSLFALLLMIILREPHINKYDLYTFFALGSLLGVQAGIIFLLILLVLASLVAIIYMFFFSRHFENIPIPLAPFIHISFLISVGYGQLFFDILLL